MSFQSILKLTTISGYNYSIEGRKGDFLLMYNNGDLSIETQIQQVPNHNISYMYQTRIKTKYGGELIIDNDTLDVQSENGNIPYELKEYKPANYIHDNKIIMPELFQAKKLTIGLLNLVFVKLLNEHLSFKSDMKLESYNIAKDAHGALVYINDVKWIS
jgi:hypothetical protein